MNQPHTEAGSIGRRLREAREAAGLRREQLAARLHIPIHIAEAIENDRYQCLGADIFIRGHLRSYARCLGVPESEVEAALPPATVAEVPALAYAAPSSRWQSWLEGLARRGVHLALTVAIVVPVVWLASHRQLPSAPSTLLPPSPSGATADESPVTPAPVRSPEPVPQLAPASLAPRFVDPRESAPVAEPAPASQAGTDAPADAGWVFEFAEDSWFELFDTGGHVVVQELVPAGSLRRFAAGQVGRVTLGNAAAVRVERDRQAVDLAPYQRANVARFRVSFGGSLAPAPAGG